MNETTNELLNKYCEMLNEYKTIELSKSQLFLERESIMINMEIYIGKQIIDDNPDIWGEEYNYIIFDIIEQNIVPIKFIDLEDAQNMSIHLQSKYYQDKSNPYFAAKIHSKNKNEFKSVLY